MLIDAHQHFWQRDRFDFAWLEAPEKSAINRDYGPDDLRAHLEACGVDGSVFVQTQHNVEENRWVLPIARETDFIKGVVGWVDLASDALPDQLAEFTADPLFVGVRHNVQDHPDDDFIVRPEILGGLKTLGEHGVPFDFLFYEQHLHHLPTVVRACPETKFVIDHISKPNIKTGPQTDWHREIREAAEFDNVWCKLSGMVTEADWTNWTVENLQPYAEAVLEAFGPQRVMYGSDWPVCELAASYAEVYAAARDLISGLSDAEQARVMGGTAIEFYGLDVKSK